MYACFFAAPAHCLQNENCLIRYWVKGQCPLWGAGATPRMVSPTHHRKIVCVINQAISGKGSRALPWSGTHAYRLLSTPCTFLSSSRTFRCWGHLRSQ
jgi:hypothetical protein